MYLASGQLTCPQEDHDGIGGVLSYEASHMPSHGMIKDVNRAIDILAECFFGAVMPKLYDGSYEDEFHPNPGNSALSFKFVQTFNDIPMIIEFRVISRRFALNKNDYADFLCREIIPAFVDLFERFEVDSIHGDPQRWAAAAMQVARHLNSHPR